MTRERTTGNILKKLVSFSLPLILSGLFQQLFNWVDALIVCNFVGETALAGVGAVTSLYNLFVTTIVGIFSLGVRIARSYAFAGIWGNMVVAYAEAFSWIFLVIVYAWRYHAKSKKL